MTAPHRQPTLTLTLIGAALVACVLAADGCKSGSEPSPPPGHTARQQQTIAGPFLKGQLHLHSSHSGDSNTPPADVARWYSEHGYDFIVFTDHNVVTALPPIGGMLVFAGIELTQNPRTCLPEPPAGMGCPLHVNGLFVQRGGPGPLQIDQPTTPDRFEYFAASLRRARELGAVAQLNHPNFHYAADKDLVARLAKEGVTLLEIANEAVDSNNVGDAAHPSTLALWDDVLGRGHKVWGVASDDAHHYYDADAVRQSGQMAFVGDRGFVMVRAAKEPKAIRDAVVRGDFYASNGVLLDVVEVVEGQVRIKVAPSAPRPEVTWTGLGGKVLATTSGHSGHFDLSALGQGEYVRATVRDGEGRTAWTQPVWR